MVGLAAPGFGDAPLAERDDCEMAGYAAVVARPLPPAMRAGIRAGFRPTEGRWTPVASPQARARG
jgi:hypothetical protein